MQLGEAVMPSNTTHVTLALDGHTGEDASAGGKWSGGQMTRRNGMNDAGGRRTCNVQSPSEESGIGPHTARVITETAEAVRTRRRGALSPPSSSPEPPSGTQGSIQRRVQQAVLSPKPANASNGLTLLLQMAGARKLWVMHRGDNDGINRPTSSLVVLTDSKMQGWAGVAEASLKLQASVPIARDPTLGRCRTTPTGQAGTGAGENAPVTGPDYGKLATNLPLTVIAQREPYFWRAGGRKMEKRQPSPVRLSNERHSARPFMILVEREDEDGNSPSELVGKHRIFPRSSLLLSPSPLFHTVLAPNLLHARNGTRGDSAFERLQSALSHLFGRHPTPALLPALQRRDEQRRTKMRTTQERTAVAGAAGGGEVERGVKTAAYDTLCTPKSAVSNADLDREEEVVLAAPY
ncbi:hypothetical protein EDB86DRAFT_2835455 [Lactarius hatsudake]|nr:hypothetical protein EDB86DRAFT_2835455 [Lactarius hatsudake]